jgi:outer membrane lipoprotein SlyB
MSKRSRLGRTGKELIMNGTIIAALPIAAIFGFAGYRVGTGRGRPVLGAVLGFALGLIGLGIFILIPRTAEAQARHNRQRAQRQQPGQPAGNQDTVR